MVAHASGRFAGGRYHFVISVLFLGILGLFGGASRADESQQVIVTAAALAAIGAALPTGQPAAATLVGLLQNPAVRQALLSQVLGSSGSQQIPTATGTSLPPARPLSVAMQSSIFSGSHIVRSSPVGTFSLSSTAYS